MILAELMKVIDLLDPQNAADHSGSSGAGGSMMAQQAQPPPPATNGQTMFQPISSADYGAAALGRAVVVEAAPWLRDGLPPGPGGGNGAAGSSWGR